MNDEALADARAAKPPFVYPDFTQESETMSARSMCCSSRRPLEDIALVRLDQPDIRLARGVEVDIEVWRPAAEVSSSRAYSVRSRRIHRVSAGAPRASVDDHAIHAQCDLGRVDGATTVETEDFDDGLGRCGSGSVWRRAEASGGEYVCAVEIRDITALPPLTHPSYSRTAGSQAPPR